MTTETGLYFPCYLHKKVLFFFFPFQLNDTAKLNQYVQCLPLPDSFEDVEPGTLCKVAGWGNTSLRKPSKYLREANLKIVARKSCDKKYASKLKITINMLCAIGKNRLFPSDACQVRSKVTKVGTRMLNNGSLFTGNKAVQHIL